MLKKGDKVNWRGAFGTEPIKEATVVEIELTKGGKDGIPLDEISWDEVYDRNVVVTLDNEHWAYASQISKLI